MIIHVSKGSADILAILPCRCDICIIVSLSPPFKHIQGLTRILAHPMLLIASRRLTGSGQVG